MEDFGKPTNRWHQTWWGVVLISLVALIFIIVIVVAGFTSWYWWQIRHGAGAFLSRQFAAPFTVSVAGNTVKPRATDRAALEIATAPALGRQGAPITIVEFIDFKCPNCQAAAPIMRQLMAKYGYTARLLVRHIPPESMHPGTTRLSEFAWCAGAQGRFWEAHDWLFSRQAEISDAPTPAELAALSREAGLDSQKMNACLNGPAAERAVKADYFDALRFGVRGTPTFFINGQKIEGVIPLSAWENYFKTIIPAIK